MDEISPEAQDVLKFWFAEIEPKQWFVSDKGFDEDLRARFGALHARAAQGACDDWAADAPSCLALVLTLDQFSRNIHRGDAAAFANDARAREICDQALADGHDMATAKEARAFFYIPYMHSEDLADQEKCIELIRDRLGEDSGNMPHAIWHRDVIARFGRFPFRNKALGRETTAEEAEFLASTNVPG